MPYSIVNSWKFIKKVPTIFGQNPKVRDQKRGEIISKLSVPLKFQKLRQSTLLASHPGGSRNIPSRFMLHKLGKAPA